MLGPVGNPYPGNLMASAGACLMLVLLFRSARLAYRRRFEKGPDNWVPALGVALVACLFLLLLGYGIWKNS